MYKTIFIGGINRSGGSLMARLLDGHSKVLSYPMEIGFPHDYSLYDIFESYTGIPLTIPEYDGIQECDVYQLLGIPREKPTVITQWGKERSEIMGVRQNYLEKVFYGKVHTSFDHAKFCELFDKYIKNAKSVVELYEARHKAYFETWDEGIYAKNKEYVVMQDSAGAYLTNIDKFFNDFNGSTFIYPLRDAFGYIASEKTRLARRYYGSRRFSWPKFPNKFVKSFNEYDLDAQIRAWMVAVTRIVLLQERYGIGHRLVVYKHENILHYPEETMRVIAEKTGIGYESVLLEPTIANQKWLGNSHQGKSSGINKKVETYYDQVLTKDEIKRIHSVTAPILDVLSKQKQTPLDLSKIDRGSLLDYKYQEKYFEDSEKLALYSALVNSPRRRVMVRAPRFTAVLAYFYSHYVRILHIPRLLKTKYFPGMGKQNYT